VAIQIDVRADLAPLRKTLRGWARDQIPFASARALTFVAQDIAKGEGEQVLETMAKATPFTRRAFGVIAATKTRQTATVFARDRQAMYLDPYAFGGRQVLFSKKAMLTPAAIPLNAYRNIPRGKIQALKGRKDIFIGKVRTRGGVELDGVWRRPPALKSGKRHRGGGPLPRGKLQLLILFTDPKTVTKHLPYIERAQSTVRRSLPRAWERGLAEALRTAWR
jgi:hypothetical protein